MLVNKIEIQISPDEVPFVEARRNPLYQKGADSTQVKDARIPDGCGALTSVHKLDCKLPFTVGAGCDGFIIQAFTPLDGNGGTWMHPSMVNGGLVVIPMANGDFANVGMSSMPWKDIAAFLSAIRFTYGSSTNLAGMRVVGFGINCVSLDAPANRKGKIYGGQLEMPIPSAIASTGGFVTGSCYGAGKTNFTAEQAMNWLLDQNNETFDVEKGMTTRVHFDNLEYDKFQAPSTLPCFISSSAYTSHDCKFTGMNNYYSNLGGGWRNFVPTQIVTNVAAGMVFELNASIILEVDQSNLSKSGACAMVPFSPRYPALRWLTNSKETYPFNSEGHSFWPSFSRAASGMFKSVVPYATAIAGSGLLGPEAQMLSKAISVTSSLKKPVKKKKSKQRK